VVIVPCADPDETRANTNISGSQPSDILNYGTTKSAVLSLCPKEYARMTFPQMCLLFLTAVVAGTLNSVAGGGSFFTVPALIFTNLPAKLANTTNTVALWPGSAASVGAYRRELAQQRRGIIILLVGTSLIGGLLGALLLLHTSQGTFVALLPYLLLTATLLFAVSGPVTKRLRSRNMVKTQTTPPVIIAITIAQFIIAIYGGYFGGGIGILMLATLALMGMEDIHAMNALKTLLATCINGIAVIAFIIANAVLWPAAIVMIVGAVLGGYGGAAFARKIEQKWIRGFVIIVGSAMTLYFFLHH
jgi:uncharacterized protein